MAARKKHPAYKVGQTVCRVYKGMSPTARKLAVAEINVQGCENNRGQLRPCLRAWNIHFDGRKGQKPDATRRPSTFLLEEIRPAKGGKC